MSQCKNEPPLEEQVTCEHCQTSWDDRQSLETHLVQCNPEKTKRIKRYRERTRGKRSTERTFECPEEGCRYKTFTIGFLSRHRRELHGVNAKPCENQRDCVEGQPLQEAHGQKTQENRRQKTRLKHVGKKGRYRCEYCDYCTDEPYRIRQHRRTHTDERPFSCDVCGKAFREQGHLNNHRRTHTGEKSYTCEVCGKSFTRNSGLEKHRRIHTGETIRCDECGAQFTHLACHTRHMKMHVKAHKCEVCSEWFATEAGLTKHTRTHTGERPFCCPFCQARYVRQEYFTKHIMTHTESVAFRAPTVTSGSIVSQT